MPNDVLSCVANAVDSNGGAAQDLRIPSSSIERPIHSVSIDPAVRLKVSVCCSNNGAPSVDSMVKTVHVLILGALIPALLPLEQPYRHL